MRVMHFRTVGSWVCNGVSLQERETVVMEFAVLQQSPELKEQSNTASEQSRDLGPGLCSCPLILCSFLPAKLDYNIPAFLS